jgi:hypothetical protein
MVALAAGACLCTAASCTISSPPPPDGDETQFCSDWAKAICQVALCNFDVPTCTAYQVTACTNFVNNLRTPTRQYSQPNGLGCIKALNAAYGGSMTYMIPAATLVSIQATCDKVVVGNQDMGASCTADNDCTGDLICASYEQGNSVCEGVTPRMAGQPCADPGDQCQGNTYCAPGSGSSPPLCTPAPTLGQTCNATTIPCASGNRCGDGDMCVALASKGEACLANTDCSTGYCDPYANVCTTGLTFALGSTDCNGIEGIESKSQPEVGSDAGGAGD